MLTPIDKDIFEIFIHILGNPTSEETLNDYIRFVLSKNVIDDGISYTEIHHILPVSVFPEYKNKTDFQATLLYENHVDAHLLLAKAYPIRKFVRPLNFMLKDRTHMNELERLSRIKGWEVYKTTDKYIEATRKKSARMSTLMKDGLASKMSTKRFEDIEERQNVGKRFSNLWKNEDYRKRCTDSMKILANTPERKQQFSDIMTKKWADNKFREEFTNHMTIVNRSVEKRLDASRKLKLKWQEPEFKEKMAKRRGGGKGEHPRYWWNNGTINYMGHLCPEGYVRGQLKRKKET